MITTLAGGVGAARLLGGLQNLLAPDDLTVVVNTADDDTFHGLYISPDIDTILYTLAGRVEPRQGWGVRGDSFACLDALNDLGAETWFRLGDRDLATHLFRSHMLGRGRTLTEVTTRLRSALGVAPRILPMSDAPIRTFVTVAGRRPLPFQEYLVRHRAEGDVQRIHVRGLRHALPAPGVLEALDAADWIIISPSNPFVSIAPILGLTGVRPILRRRRSRTIAISPIVGGRPVKGPLDRMLRGLGHEVSATGVARLYRSLIGTFVLDRRDSNERSRIEDLGMRVVVADTLMSTQARSHRLAARIIEATTAGVPH